MLYFFYIYLALLGTWSIGNDCYHSAWWMSNMEVSAVLCNEGSLSLCVSDFMVTEQQRLNEDMVACVVLAGGTTCICETLGLLNSFDCFIFPLPLSHLLLWNGSEDKWF